MSGLGIIGGADGPTAVFVTGNPVAAVIGILFVIALVGAGVALFRHRK